ncbi:hypothetical protein [Aeromonas veronii]
MKNFITVLSFSVFSLFFQESAFAANGLKCFDNVRLSYVNIGYTDGSIASADEGNAIYIGYYENNNTRLRESKVDYRLNFNDGPKGFAMYQSLITALALGLKVTAWDHDLTPGGTGTCADFDEIRLKY